MIRLPSVQQRYHAFYSGDPAFMQLERGELDDAAWAKAQADHEHKLKVAQETGDWSPLLAGTSEPTTFVMRLIPGETYRRLGDQVFARKVGRGELNALLVRAALVDVLNLGDHKVETAKHPELGDIATAATTNFLDRIDMQICNELAAFIQDRQTLSPK